MVAAIKDKIKTYYLPPFILAQIMVGLGALGQWIKGNAKGDNILGAWVFASIGLTLLLGGLYHAVSEYLGPKRTIKLAKHKKLKSLVLQGFKFNEEIPGYEKYHLGFHSIVSAVSNMDGEHVFVGCLVSVPEHDFDATLDFADKRAYDIFGAGNGTAWICDKLAVSMFVNLPDVDAIVSTLDKLVFDLKSNRYVPGERPM